jgi:hypothetical protein
MKSVLFAALLALCPIFTVAHEWYDPWCCNTNDCAMVPTASVTPTADGWLVVLEPGDHPLITRRIEEVIPYDAKGLLRSRDENFHACIRHDNANVWDQLGAVRCLYVPDMLG